MRVAIAVVGAFLGYVAAPAGEVKRGVTVTRLRCEYKANPLGIDAARPRLSWVLESDARGEVQTAFQVLVARDDKGLEAERGDLWDSGKVGSDRSTHVVYGGRELGSCERAVWKVRAWDKDGAPSPWSAPASWETGLLRPEDWKAKWIGLKRLLVKDIGGAPPDPCPHFRKTVTVGRPVARARVHATALGLYELSINGKRVGEDRFSPGWTAYQKRLQVQTYDVTGLLSPGENVLGAIVGDGWFSGKIGWMQRAHNVYGPGPVRLRAQLEIETADGGRQVVATDGSWKGARGPILAGDFMDGETYDARLEMPAWDRPGFNDAAWSPVEVIDDQSPRLLVAQPDAGVQVTEELKPITVKEVKPGVFVYDLAQNMVGWVRLKVRGPAGAEVTLRFAEMLNPDGTIYTKNLRKAKATDRYILKGEGEEIWEPRFTFHGFRYVELTGYPGAPGLDAIIGRVAHSATPPTGSFECSSSMLNQLQRNIQWGQRGNFVSIPTDCPQRDERLGWMGDAQIFVRTACWNMDVAAFFTKWLRDVDDAQSPEGAFSDVSPRMGRFNDAAPAWGDAGVICPWVVYLCYGDRRILEEHYPAMKKWVDYVRRHNPDLLWTKEVHNNYGDWVAVGSDTPKEVLSTAYFALSARLVSKAAKALGQEEDAKNYESLFQSIKVAFQKAFLVEDGRLWGVPREGKTKEGRPVQRGHTQTCYVLALRFDLLPENLRESAAKYLVEDLEAHRGHLTTGFLGVGHLLAALSETGRWDAAYRLLTNETFPSWGYSIKHGATTIWERWDGWTSEKGFQDPGMNSFNHYAFGSVGEWMYANVAGIDLDPEKPGYKHILIKPRPGGGLTYGRGTLESAYGTISSEWRIEGKTFTLKVRIPANTTATVTLPYVKNAKGDAKPIEGAVHKIGSGAYQYSAELD